MLGPGEPEVDSHDCHDDAVEQGRCKGQTVRAAEPQVQEYENRKQDR